MRNAALFTSALSLALCATAGAQEARAKAQASTVVKTTCETSCDAVQAETVAVRSTCCDETKQASTVAATGTCFEATAELARIFGQDVELDDVTVDLSDLHAALKNIQVELADLEELEGIEVDLSALEGLENIGVDPRGLGGVAVQDRLAPRAGAPEALSALGYAVSAGDERGFLGIYMGLGDDGMVVTSVMDGGPAVDMGLEAGDRIVRINDHTLSGNDMEFLQKLRAGESVRVVAVRGDKQLKLKGRLQTLASIQAAGEDEEDEEDEVEIIEEEPVEGREVRRIKLGVGAPPAGGQLRYRVQGKNIELDDGDDDDEGEHEGHYVVQLHAADGEWTELRDVIKQRVERHIGQAGQGKEQRKALLRTDGGRQLVIEVEVEGDGHDGEVEDLVEHGEGEVLRWVQRQHEDHGSHGNHDVHVDHDVVIEQGGNVRFGTPQGGHGGDVKVQGKVIVIGPDGQRREFEFGDGGAVHGDHDVRVEGSRDAQPRRYLLRRGDGDFELEVPRAVDVRRGDPKVKVEGKAIFIGEDGQQRELEFGGRARNPLPDQLLELHGSGGGQEGGSRVFTLRADDEGGQVIESSPRGGTWITPHIDEGDVLLPRAGNRPLLGVLGGNQRLRWSSDEDEDDDDDNELEEQLEDLQEELDALRQEIRELRAELRRRR
jgi:hypothetical protein